MSKAKSYDVHTIGRRKSAVARVYVSRGSGKITINAREVGNYFPKGTSRYIVYQPLNLMKVNDSYDFNINVQGGGVTGQAGAIRLGIASRQLLPKARYARQDKALLYLYLCVFLLRKKKLRPLRYTRDTIPFLQ